MGRPYALARRAELVRKTRRRIIEAAIELHGTVGPARTTISAVADRAGVQRLTVYRHFPDEAALFRACGSQWLIEHPPPDFAQWSAHADPALRLEHALRELYAYFARTAAMWAHVYRDAPVVPALQAPLSAWLEYLGGARNTLVRGWRVDSRQRRRLEVAIGHALAFSTWASLVALGSDAQTAVGLMAGMVGCVARSEDGRGRRRAAR